MKKHLLGVSLSLCTIIALAQSGITWQMSMDIASNAHGNMHPRVVMDGSGNPLVIWGRMSDESVFFSRWTGAAFSPALKVNPVWLTVATASWMGPDIAAKGDTIYVVVKRTPEMSDTNHIYLIRSFDGGQNFMTPVRVDYINDSVSRFPTVAIDDDGNPVVAFMKFNSAFGDSRWVVTKSLDGGNTFQPDVKASGWSGMMAQVCDCCPGALLMEGSQSLMLYRDNLSNLRDMWVGYSNNGGASFTAGSTFDNTNWNINYCPSSGPDGALIGDTLYSVFMSGGSGNMRVYLSKTTVSDQTLASSNMLGGTIPGLSQQNYPRIDRFGNALAIVWRQSVSGVAQLPMYFTNNVANGLPAKYDSVRLGDVTNSDVAVGDGKVVVVWEDDNAGTVKYRMGSYTTDSSVLTKTNELTENPFEISVYPNPSSQTWNITGRANDKISSVELINSIGERIAVPGFVQNEKAFSISINSNKLTSGNYYLKLSSGSKTQNVRLMKN